MTREQRNKETIGGFGQTENFKMVTDALAKIHEGKRKLAVILRQLRDESKDTSAELQLLYDDVLSVAPGLTYEQFKLVYCYAGLNRIERMLNRRRRDDRDDFHPGANYEARNAIPLEARIRNNVCQK